MTVIGTLVNGRTDEEHEVGASPTSIGRHEANEIRLRGFAISRFHAEIGETAPGHPYIEDMGSTYGTYVNGHKLDGRVSLHDGDEVSMGVSSGFPQGEYAFVFHKTEGAPESSAATHKKTPTRHAIRDGIAKLDKTSSAYIFHLDGIFRRSECDALASETMKLVQANPKDVVLELSHVQYMNSYALGMIVRLSDDVSLLSKSVVLAGAEGLVLKLLTTVGLDRMLKLVPTEKEALAELAEGA